MIHPET